MPTFGRKTGLATLVLPFLAGGLTLPPRTSTADPQRDVFEEETEPLDTIIKDSMPWQPTESGDPESMFLTATESGDPLSRVKPTTREWELMWNATASCSRWQTTKPQLENAVLVYMITRHKDVGWFINRTMARTWTFFLQRWRYPVVVFVPSQKLREYDQESYGESPTPDSLRERLKRIGLPKNIDLTIAEFDLKLPKVLAADKNWRQRRNDCAQKVRPQYMHMNQFYTKVMYEHPSLAKYRYYMRLDADLMFTKDIEHDPFCVMKKTGRKFLFQSRHHVFDPSCSNGMWDWFETYAKNSSMVAKDELLWRPSSAEGTYAGYIGVGDLEFFRSKKVKKLAAAFNEDGRVYLNRWSDQSYYVLLLALMEDHDAVGDVGIRWPVDTWCHKCRPPIATVGQLAKQLKDSKLRKRGPLVVPVAMPTLQPWGHGSRRDT